VGIKFGDFSQNAILLTAGRTLHVWSSGPKITLHFLRLFVPMDVCIFVHPLLSHVQQLCHVHCCHATLLQL